jgi:hypothetical protein
MATFLVEITNMCKATQVPETIGISGTKRFLVACRASDPKYGMSGLQALVDLEDADTAISSVEDYVSIEEATRAAMPSIKQEPKSKPW